MRNLLGATSLPPGPAVLRHITSQATSNVDSTPLPDANKSDAIQEVLTQDQHVPSPCIVCLGVLQFFEDEQGPAKGQFAQAVSREGCPHDRNLDSDVPEQQAIAREGSIQDAKRQALPRGGTTEDSQHLAPTEGGNIQLGTEAQVVPGDGSNSKEGDLKVDFSRSDNQQQAAERDEGRGSRTEYFLRGGEPTARIVQDTCQRVREGRHQISDFCLEVTVPALTAVRERAVWYHLRQTFPSHGRFHGQPGSDSCSMVSLKEAFKWALLDPLAAALGGRFDSASDFRIAILFTHAESAAELDFVQPQGGVRGKRKRQGGNWRAAQGRHSDSGDGYLVDGSLSTSQSAAIGQVAAAAARAGIEEGENGAAVQRALASMDLETFQRHYPWPPPQLADGCGVQVLTWRNPVYVGGRYLKFSRSVSQSPWLVDEERMGDGSVQELIAAEVVPAFQADGCKFQAAGREDIDVRMLGSGRPFLLELLNARILPPPISVAQIESRINGAKNKWVRVRQLQLVGPTAAALMREGEADKQKVYRALIWLSRDVLEEDLAMLASTKELVIQQKTPIRVLHRRSPLTRPRTIHSMRGEKVPGKSQFMVLHLTTQAGTYVKEFVGGDLGRTQPHLGSLLGCDADILQLDVMDIKMNFP